MQVIKFFGQPAGAIYKYGYSTHFPSRLGELRLRNAELLFELMRQEIQKVLAHLCQSPVPKFCLLPCKSQLTLTAY